MIDTMDKTTRKTFDRIKKMCGKYNAFLLEQINRFGTDELYLDKSSTIISAPEKAPYIDWHETDVPGNHSLELDLGFGDRRTIGESYDIENGYYTSYSYDEIAEDVKYMTKCVKNGVKFMLAEDPDKYLEKYDDEE